MNFKDDLETDIADVFMDDEEFAAVCLVDDKEIPVIINDLGTENNKGDSRNYNNGVNSKRICVAVSVLDFEVPEVDQEININGLGYIVEECTDNEGMLLITMERNQS